MKIKEIGPIGAHPQHLPHPLRAASEWDVISIITLEIYYPALRLMHNMKFDNTMHLTCLSTT